MGEIDIPGRRIAGIFEGSALSLSVLGAGVFGASKFAFWALRMV